MYLEKIPAWTQTLDDPVKPIRQDTNTGTTRAFAYLRVSEARDGMQSPASAARRDLVLREGPYFLA
jgi:hypothetical protein